MTCKAEKYFDGCSIDICVEARVDVICLHTYVVNLLTLQFCLVLKILKFLYSVALQPQTLEAGVQLQILCARKPYKIF